MAITYTAATDLANAAMDFYVKGKAIAQSIQDRPLLAFLKEGQETFPSGKDYIKRAVKGVYIAANDGTTPTYQGEANDFFSPYSDDDLLKFSQATLPVWSQWVWKELHAGLAISWTELKQDGITVTDSQKTSEHSRAEVTRLLPILKSKLDDFTESYARKMNWMLWNSTGTTGVTYVPGVRESLQDTNINTVGGIAQSANTWWKQVVDVGTLTASEASQTVTKAFRAHLRTLRRYGGKPDKILAGSDLIVALETELAAKAYYTMEWFSKEGTTDFGMADIRLKGVGKFEYDPSMDDFSMSKYAIIFDSRHIKLQPMEGEDNKMLKPERPYDQLVFLQSMTWTGGLTFDQMNCHAVISIA